MVSNKGRVYSVITSKCLCLLKGEYLSIDLCVRGVGDVRRSIHRLVASAFLPNPKHLPQVNHKDFNKYNNSLGNLEWCSAQHNNEHARAKSYHLLSPLGFLVEIFNLKKYCRDNGISSGLQGVASGALQQHKGWTLPVIFPQLTACPI